MRYQQSADGLGESMSLCWFPLVKRVSSLMSWHCLGAKRHKDGPICLRLIATCPEDREVNRSETEEEIIEAPIDCKSQVYSQLTIRLSGWMCVDCT